MDVVTIGQAQRARTDSDVVFANVIGDTDGTVSVIQDQESRTFSSRAEGLSFLIERLLDLACD